MKGRCTVLRGQRDEKKKNVRGRCLKKKKQKKKTTTSSSKLGAKRTGKGSRCGKVFKEKGVRGGGQVSSGR